MNVWDRFTGWIGDGAGVVGALIEGVWTRLAGDPVARRQFAFSMALIALSAKMAKADGVVVEVEVAAFRRLFSFPEKEAGNVRRLFQLAYQDVAGFEAYASRIARLYEPGDPILRDIVDGLFEIATADHYVLPAEIVFLREVARRFGMEEVEFETIKLRHVMVPDDPYRVLGVSADLPFEELKRAYRRLVAEHHPDRLMARGVPNEFVVIANHRLAAINVAWGRIEAVRRPKVVAQYKT